MAVDQAVGAGWVDQQATQMVECCGSSAHSSSETVALHALRHSAAHVTAQAVKRLFPNVKLAIGPPIDTGYYYDIDCPVKITDEDLAKLEQEIAKIIKADFPFKQSSMSKQEALAFFEQRGEPFKVEIIKGLDADPVSIYTDGEFVDLCEGPHIASTGKIPAIKLLSVAGAYWRGDEHNPQLQRIYGTAFGTQQELDAHLKRLEEAKARDHRRLGKELGLFSFFEEVAGPGVVFYQPKGALLRMLIEDYVRQEHLRRGYQLVATPHLFRSELWKRSGHLDYYREHMFMLEADDIEYGLKPMNCPGHILIYQSQMRSYRDLPLRFFELGTVYRFEKSGVLHGLLRVRGFTQDDAHIFCRPEQLVDEIERIIGFCWEVLTAFGFTQYEVELSTKPAKAIGSAEDWERAESALAEALKRRGVSFEVHAGEGAFYGPKIDVKITDAIGRAWQCSTIQCDFALPERFGLAYVGEDGKEQRPIMLHRALLGSLERFLGTLIEHYGGALPLWLSPVQVVVIPISERAAVYAAEVALALRAVGIRVDVDDRNERMQAKIRDAQLAKVPYMTVVGEREAAVRTVAVRSRAGGDQGAVALDQFVKQLTDEVVLRRC